MPFFAASLPYHARLLFWALVGTYALVYAPYGINETDGGFLTGLAWQCLSGKTLYTEILYVRPPLPVWLRALELRCLPDTWAILGERWIFYFKMGLTAYWGAGALWLSHPWRTAAVPSAQSIYRYWIAAFVFVVSVHCYPASAWHTVDGLLFGALALRLAVNAGVGQAFCSGIAVALAMACKQSFYPLLVLPLLAPYPTWRARGASALGLALALGGGLAYLAAQGSLSDFWALTASAAQGGQALQHGLLDYFRIPPVLAIFTALLLLIGAYGWRRVAKGPITFATRKTLAYARTLPLVLWALWLVGLGAAYAATLWQHQDFSLPFGQTRLLFWVASVYCLGIALGGGGLKTGGGKLLKWGTPKGIYPAVGIFLARLNASALAGSLLLTWCAAVSWGYNLPILYATPWVFVALRIGRRTWALARPTYRLLMPNALALTALLGLFWVAYGHIYRDGPRAAMYRHLGEIYPALQGIYSTQETYDLYQDLQRLVSQYGPHYTVLPSFPQADFLNKTRPILPLDWVVSREMGGRQWQVAQLLAERRPTLLIEKRYAEALGRGGNTADKELSLARQCLESGRVVGETAFFWVVR